MAHTIRDSHNLGFRKDNLVEEKDGSDDDVQGERNKVSWRKASQMTGQDTRSLTLTHSHINSHMRKQTSIFSWPVTEANIQSLPPFTSLKKTPEEICLVFFLLSGTDYLQVLSNHVGTLESLEWDLCFLAYPV